MTVADWPACSTLDPDRSEFSCALCSAAAYCCGAVAPRAIAALLGRFLPRLGPLVHSSGPFFFVRSFIQREWNGGPLLRRGLERSEIAKRHGRERVGHRAEISRHLCEPRSTLAPPLVHVDRAVEFELDGMQAARRIAVMLGDEAAGIGLVAADRIAERAHGRFDHVG